MKSRKKKTLDFLIIGGMKCASTSLQNSIQSHPDIYMKRGMETGYFLTPAQSVDFKGMTADEIRGGRDDRELLSWMLEDYFGERLFGERCTDYTKRPFKNVDIPKMHGMNDEMRLLYIVRNPLERIVSNYYHFLVSRPREIDKDFNREISGDPFYVELSRYSCQLGPYLETFGKDMIHVVLMEDLAIDSGMVLRGICRFLGVDESADLDGGKIHHANPLREKDGRKTRKFSKGTFEKTVGILKRDVDDLCRHMDRDLYDTWNLDRELWVEDR